MRLKAGILFCVVMSLLWACKKNNTSAKKEPATDPTNTVVREEDERRVIVENPPIDSNAESITLSVSRSQNGDAVGYRYALVSLPSKDTDTGSDEPSATQDPNVLTIILGNKDFIAKLMAQHGGKIMSEALKDPDITAKIKSIGMKIVTNQNILNSIMQADGIDTAALMKHMQDVLASVGKMEKAKTEKEKGVHRKAIFAVLGKIQKNKKLMDVIIDALLQESAFIANIIREEAIISSILGKKEIIDSIVSADGGEDLKALIDIPAVISNLDNIFADMLEDSEFVRLVTEPATRATIENLMSYSSQLENQRKKKKKNKAKINELNAKVNTEMLKLSTNTELMFNVLDRLLLRVPNESQGSSNEDVAAGVDHCAEAEYSELMDISSRLSLEVGGFGKKILCIVGYDSRGNRQQGVSRYEWERTYTPSIYFADAGLPKTESHSNSVKITVNASDESLAGYRYLLLHDQSSCSLDFNEYSAVVKGFATPITATLDKPGLKILCVYGVDSSNRIASVINFHSWYYKLPPPPPSTSNTGDDKTPPPSAVTPTVDYSKGLMEVRSPTSSNNYFYPGDNVIKNVELKNTGKGALSWSLKVDYNHSWLLINKGDGNWQPVRNASDADKNLGFIRADLAAGSVAKVSFKVVDNMALGAPYYREARFSLVNNATGFVSSFMLRLYVPRLLLTNSVIGFSSNNKSEKRILVLANSGSGNLLWDIVPLPNRSNWWSMRIKRNPNGTGMVEFTLNKDNLPTAKGAAEYVQHFAIFSNGDAQGVESCKASAASSFSGSSRVNWPTADCHDFKLLYRKN